MALSKKVTLTVDGYNVKINTPLKFYQNDQLHLIFEIVETTLTVKNGVASREVLPINPLNATLYLETPEGVDSLESAEIVDNTVTFHLTSTYTQFVGVSKMQIVLMDDECCRITLPEFEFEIKKGIFGN